MCCPSCFLFCLPTAQVHLVCPWLRLCPGVPNSTQPCIYKEKLEEKEVSPILMPGDTLFRIRLCHFELYFCWCFMFSLEDLVVQFSRLYFVSHRVYNWFLVRGWSSVAGSGSLLLFVPFGQSSRTLFVSRFACVSKRLIINKCSLPSTGYCVYSFMLRVSAQATTAE